MKDTITIELDLKNARAVLEYLKGYTTCTQLDQLSTELETAISAYDEAHSQEPLVRHGVPYTNTAQKQFILDMEAAGYDIRLYNGRCFYYGPAVVVGVVTQVTSKTRVPVGWDNLGFDFIVHPSASDSKLKH